MDTKPHPIQQLMASTTLPVPKGNIPLPSSFLSLLKLFLTLLLCYRALSLLSIHCMLQTGEVMATWLLHITILSLSITTSPVIPTMYVSYLKHVKILLYCTASSMSGSEWKNIGL